MKHLFKHNSSLLESLLCILYMGLIKLVAYGFVSVDPDIDCSLVKWVFLLFGWCPISIRTCKNILALSSWGHSSFLLERRLLLWLDQASTVDIILERGVSPPFLHHFYIAWLWSDSFHSWFVHSILEFITILELNLNINLFLLWLLIDRCISHITVI